MPPTERTATGQPRCQATTQAGAPCRAFATGGVYCRVHDPSQAEAVRAARARGGAKASQLRALRGRRAKLETPGQLLAFTGRLIQDLVEHHLDPDTGRAALYGINVAAQLLKTHQFEERLAALEARLQTRGAGRWG